MSVWQKALANQIWLVGVSGRLDQTITPALEQTLTHLLDAQHSRLIVNLSQTSYINSGGLRCLVAAWRRARRQQGDLILCGLNQRLYEIFAMVGFDQVFTIVPTQQAAEQALP